MDCLFRMAFCSSKPNSTIRLVWGTIEIFAGNKINRNLFIEFKVFKNFCFDFCFEFWFEFLFRLLFSYLFSWQTNQISLKHDHNLFLYELPALKTPKLTWQHNLLSLIWVYLGPLVQLPRHCICFWLCKLAGVFFAPCTYLE